MEANKQVFVLGAGFTRAFLPKAPLLIDTYDLMPLRDMFKGFHSARAILDLEISKTKQHNGLVNIEMLMTRLAGLMPYDFEIGAENELSLLLAEIKVLFKERLEKAKLEHPHDAEMASLASYCISKGITCITFNYDDVFDQALWEVAKVQDMTHTPYWHPDGGYGFFCRVSLSCVRDMTIFMDKTAMRLLKLHGSVNWRLRRGCVPPYAIDAIVHHEKWMPTPYGITHNEEEILLHLQNEPFIVPPVLVKSSLVEQPILRLLWYLAYQELSTADEVIFVGYSLPITDIAASTLLTEALWQTPTSQLKVVNYATTEEEKNEVRKAYRNVFPTMSDDQFDFGGALNWARNLAPIAASPQSP